MSKQKPELWRELCEMAIVEPNPQRVTELFQQIDQLLADTEEHSGSEGSGPEPLQSDAA